MNRRRFLALLPTPFLTAMGVAACPGDEVTIPVEPSADYDCYDDELDAWYDCDTGEVIWSHGDLVFGQKLTIGDYDVTIPVEPCPCDCLDETTGEFYLCNADGSPIEPLSDDTVSYPQDIVQLPNTGSGSAQRLPSSGWFRTSIEVVELETDTT